MSSGRRSAEKMRGTTTSDVMQSVCADVGFQPYLRPLLYLRNDHVDNAPVFSIWKSVRRSAELFVINSGCPLSNFEASC